MCSQYTSLFQNGQDSSFEGFEIREVLFQDAYDDLGIDFVFGRHSSITAGLRGDYYINTVLKYSEGDWKEDLYLDYIPLVLFLSYGYYF